MRITNGADQWEFTARQQALMLGLLSVRAGETVYRDELVSEMWHGLEQPTSIASSLTVCVHYIRTRIVKVGLMRETIKGVPNGYVLQIGDGTTDLAEFEELAKNARIAASEQWWEIAQQTATDALMLWRGQFLGGVATGPSLLEVSRYATGLRSEMQELKARAVLTLGNHAEAISGLLRLVLEQPMNLELRVLLIKAYWRNGMKTAAISACEQARRNFQNTAGADTVLVDLLDKMNRDEGI
jgi:DNA-binding SARP family transcriptional activator